MGRFVIRKCLITIIIFISWAPAPLADIQLSFGVYATDKPPVVVKKFKPVVRALERALTKDLGQPVDIKMQVASTYEKGITKPWISRSGLDERVVGALRESLLTIREARALKALKKDGFLPGHDSDYALVRTAINNNTLFFQ